MRCEPGDVVWRVSFLPQKGKDKSYCVGYKLSVGLLEHSRANPMDVGELRERSTQLGYNHKVGSKAEANTNP